MLAGRSQATSRSASRAESSRSRESHQALEEDLDEAKLSKSSLEIDQFVAKHRSEVSLQSPSVLYREKVTRGVARSHSSSSPSDVGMSLSRSQATLLLSRPFVVAREEDVATHGVRRGMLASGVGPGSPPSGIVIGGGSRVRCWCDRQGSATYRRVTDARSLLNCPLRAQWRAAAAHGLTRNWCCPRRLRGDVGST